MKILGLVLALFTFQCWANCQVSNGKSLVTIPEGKRVSLFETGKSLSTHKLQDQDGLGTCYANATSAVLKSVLPQHPDVSYLHAAVSASTRGWSQEFKNGGNKYVSDNNSDFTHGGWMCETIAALKKAGGACVKNESILEQRRSGVDPYVQARLLKGLGKYFDQLNQVKSNPQKLNDLKNELSQAFELINLEKDNLRQMCENRKKEKFPVEVALKRFLADAISYYLNTENACTKSRLERVKKLLSSDSVLTKDRLFVNPSKQSQEAIVKLLEADPAIAANVESYMAAESFKEADLKDLAKKVLPKFDEYLRSQTAMDETGLNCANNYSHSFLLGNKPEQEMKWFLEYMQEIKQRDCQKELYQDDARFKLLTANEQQLCLASENFSKILDAVIPLATVGAKLNEDLYGDMTNPVMAYAHQITNAIMPGCMDPKNLKSLKDISCASFSMCADTGDDGARTYTGPKDSCYSPADAQYLVRMKVFNNIQSGKAMGVGVCTAFMDNPKARTDFCRKEVQGIEGHGYHEMTLSGYRCNKGKIEYEVLNSWGNSCPAGESNKNEALECEQNENGLPNGRFWVKEEVLVDSMTDMTQVSVR